MDACEGCECVWGVSVCGCECVSEMCECVWDVSVYEGVSVRCV